MIITECREGMDLKQVYTEALFLNSMHNNYPVIHLRVSIHSYLPGCNKGLPSDDGEVATLCYLASVYC